VLRNLLRTWMPSPVMLFTKKIGVIGFSGKFSNSSIDSLCIKIGSFLPAAGDFIIPFRVSTVLSRI